MLHALTRRRGAADHAEVLNALCANVMVADAELNIISMNDAVRDLLLEAEADLRKELPRFSVSTLIGSNIDIFHKNPSHQRAMLARLREPHSATIRVGRRAFDLRVSPLRQGDKTSGFVVEWADAKHRLASLDFAAQIEALGRSQARVEFTPDGIVVDANTMFLDAMGYRLEEIVGQKHALFVDRELRESQAYRDIWAALQRGEYQVGEFRRVAKDGRPVIIQGCYNPIAGPDGKIAKVVKFATDITRRVAAVDEVGLALTALASGDLERRIRRPFPPELDKLRTDFNAALETLQGAMTRVGSSAETIRAGADEIRGSSDDMSRRTEQQAASLEQTAAALDEVTAAVKRSAANAKEAATAAVGARRDAEQSGAVMREAIEAMGEIEQSSSQITQIVGVIDEIAFQTNLLALNAGVEAARAGEAGRGFAVVASEVRALAQRSAEAAKEIKTLIAGSTSQVERGVKLVGETGQALDVIVGRVAEIDGLIADIAASAEEQSISLNEVNTAVNRMDQVTQQNAAMVEEATAAAHSLRQETEVLAGLIAQFHLGDPGRAEPPARPARAAQVVRMVVPGGRRPSTIETTDPWEEF